MVYNSNNVVFFLMVSRGGCAIAMKIFVVAGKSEETSELPTSKGCTVCVRGTNSGLLDCLALFSGGQMKQGVRRFLSSLLVLPD